MSQAVFSTTTRAFSRLGECVASVILVFGSAALVAVASLL